MVSNITYKFSCFANYSDLSYKKDDVIRILELFDDPTLAPGIIQEIHFDNILTQSQRMQFVAQNGLFVMQINSDRIDISLTSNEKEGFHAERIPAIKEKLSSAMKNLYTAFGERAPIPHRLAWNTSYVFFEIAEDEKRNYRGKFLKELEFFEENRLDDTVIRYACQRDVLVNDKTEKINALATINSYITDPGTENEINGFRIDYDINTWQGNRLNRFIIPSFSAFIDKAIEIQNKLNYVILP